jgi:hypothetical protein
LLAFHPPEPTYELRKDEDSGSKEPGYSFILGEDIGSLKKGMTVRGNPSVHLIKSSPRISIPILFFSHPEAKLTV